MLGAKESTPPKPNTNSSGSTEAFMVDVCAVSGKAEKLATIRGITGVGSYCLIAASSSLLRNNANANVFCS